MKDHLSFKTTIQLTRGWSLEGGHCMSMCVRYAMDVTQPSSAGIITSRMVLFSVEVATE